MRLGRYLSSLTMPELEELKPKLNLSDDEEKVFDELSKGRSNVTVALNCGIATSTLSNRIKAIVSKYKRIGS